MQGKLTVAIELGNEAMNDLNDAASALKRVVKSLRGMGQSEVHIAGGAIQDENGNTVGRWAFEAEGAKQ